MAVIRIERKCADPQCSTLADVYAIDQCYGGWGDYYCHEHTPETWDVVDTIEKENK
jgi:hypothetical protein